MLRDEYHLLSIDLPGHGMTPAFKNDEDYAIPNLTQWVLYVVELFGKDSFYLMAHSWCGCIALHFSALYPEKIRKILLLDGAYQLIFLKFHIYFT